MNKYENYREFVRALCKPGEAIKAEITPEDCHRLHMAVGVSGEAGELLDAIKKAAIYRKPLDIANVREEAGDILFYLTGLLDSLDIELDSVIAENVGKLSLRYRSLSYSNAQAIERLDKLESLDKGHGAEVKPSAPAIDPEADMESEIIPRACSMDDPDCESCQ